MLWILQQSQGVSQKVCFRGILEAITLNSAEGNATDLELRRAEC